MNYQIPTTPAQLRSERTAATRRGMTPEEYRARRMAGESYCPKCEQWLDNGEFNRDASRPQGLALLCAPCKTGKDASAYRRRVYIAGGAPESRCACGKAKDRRATQCRTCRRAESMAQRAARQAEAEQRLREREEQRAADAEARMKPGQWRNGDKPVVLPYAFRNNRPGSLTEALRIDTMRSER